MNLGSFNCGVTRVVITVNIQQQQELLNIQRWLARPGQHGEEVGRDVMRGFLVNA